jgi:hypothetical protein
MMVDAGTVQLAVALTTGLLMGAVALMATSTAVSGASAAGAFDPKKPDPNAAKKAEEEARRRKQAEITARKGRGASIVTGGAGLGGEKDSSLGQSSLLGGS